MTARVLLIEDNLPIADLLAEALRTGLDDVEVVVASTAATGIDRIRRQPVDCVLLDYMLPDCDGLECLSRIRESWPDLPVIIITAEGSQDVAVEAMKRGATDYVVKHGTFLSAVVAKVREAIAKGERARATKRLAHGVFVGRATEVAVLREAVEASVANRGGLCLIEGEAGTGKTTLVRQVAAFAEGRGFRVLWGRCHQTEGSPPYWPWIEILRACMNDLPDDDLRTDLRSAGSSLLQIVPELVDRLGEPARAATTADIAPEQARFRLYDSVTRFLKNTARRQPTLVVLDDVQWADLSSILLLQFLGRELGNTTLLAICAYRDVELAENQAAASAIAQLRGEGSTHHLRGLSEEEVKQQIAMISNQKVPARFARTLYERTEGNPFFVEEILRLLIEEGVVYHDGGRWTARLTPEEMPIPDGAREIFLRRLAHISDPCRQILSIASVIGREFGLDVLMHLGSQPIEQTCELLDEAVKARIIAQRRGPVHEYIFCQAMVRDLLYESLSMLARGDLHHRLAEYLETARESDLDLHVASLAHHFLRTTDPNVRAKAYDYALRAAARAEALMAHEEAARHYETALRALPSSQDGNAAKRFETLLKATECWWRAADGTQARRVALEAIEIARSRGSATDFARAALAYAGQLPGFGAVVCDQTVVRLLEEALLGLPDSESGLQALLMGRLAEEITFSDERERRRLLGQNAVDMARRSGDPSVLASVLKNRHWALWTPENIEGRLEQADEVIRLAGATRDASMAFEGHLFRCLAKLELADVPAVQEELAACSRIACELRQPYQLWLVAVVRACLAFSQGRLQQIEGLAHQALELGDQAQNPSAALFHDVQLAHLCWLRGQFVENMDIAQKIGCEYPLLISSLQSALAVVFSEQGNTDAAHAQFESLAVDDFKQLARNVTWATNLTHLAQVCAKLGDTERAARLYELLRPFEHRIVVLVPVVPWGPACHYLGLLAATMGDTDLAGRHYEDAIAMSKRLGMAQWLARTQLAYAESLLSRADAIERARSLLEDSCETAEALSMPVVANRARSLLLTTLSAAGDTAAPTVGGADTSNVSIISDTSHLSAPPQPSFPDDRKSDSVDSSRLNGKHVARMYREGGDWIVVYKEKRIPGRELTGFDYLQYLLREPRREFHVVELWTLVHGPDPDNCSRPCAELNDPNDPDRLGIPGDLGEIVDNRGIQSIRKYLETIDGRIEEARRSGDEDRVFQLGRDREFARRYLKGASGLHGKPRTAGDPIDGKRQNVQKAIRRATKVVLAKDDELGWYLWSDIKTGFWCSYQPDPTHPVTWEF